MAMNFRIQVFLISLFFIVSCSPIVRVGSLEKLLIRGGQADGALAIRRRDDLFVELFGKFSAVNYNYEVVAKKLQLGVSNSPSAYIPFVPKGYENIIEKWNPGNPMEQIQGGLCFTKKISEKVDRRNCRATILVSDDGIYIYVYGLHADVKTFLIEMAAVKEGR